MVKRRIMGRSSREEEVALQMYNIYVQERNRHTIRRETGRNLYDRTAWTQQLGDLPAERRRTETENVEDGLDDRKPRGGMTPWLKLARFVLEKQFDPEQFIRDQFTNLDLAAPVPFPDFFRSDRAVDNYRLGRESAANTLKVELTDSELSFRQRVARHHESHPGKSEDMCWLAVLWDPDARLSPLFRYLVARGIVARQETREVSRFTELMAHFTEEAMLRFCRDADLYKRLWAKLLPKGFAEEAAATYRMVYGIDRGDDRE